MAAKEDSAAYGESESGEHAQLLSAQDTERGGDHQRQHRQCEKLRPVTDAVDQCQIVGGADKNKRRAVCEPATEADDASRPIPAAVGGQEAQEVAKNVGRQR